MNFSEFTKTFPDEEACMDHLYALRYNDLKICPKCGKAVKFYRVKDRKCYECGSCAYQLYPMAGTIFEGSTTDLRKWFFAIFLFSTSKNGISSRELSRTLGVTLKTGWRIGHQIRKLMKDDGEVFRGIVELDESLVGGRAKGKRGWGAENKTCVFGIVERGGKVRTKVVPNRSKNILFPIITSCIIAGTTIFTDEFNTYKTLNVEGYTHEKVVHSKYQWTNGDCHTNSLEGYWSNLKKSILGTHTWVSVNHLQAYLDEFSFRYSHRKNDIFEEIMKRLAECLTIAP